MAAQRSIAFLSDFGHHDPFVGICHAVIARHDPAITVIDLTHGVERQNVVAGAVALVDAVVYLPDGCVVLAVVDPGVGGRRRAVAVEAVDGKLFVGPDNGLLVPAIERAGGAVAAVDVGESSWRLEPVSNTFHGRDIFSPVSARLASGASLAEAGTAIDPASLERIRFPSSYTSEGILTTAVIDIDTFGNIRLAATRENVSPDREPVDAEVNGNRFGLVLATSYESAASEHVALLTGSSGHLELAIRNDSAAELMKVRSGDEIKIHFA